MYDEPGERRARAMWRLRQFIAVLQFVGRLLISGLAFFAIAFLVGCGLLIAGVRLNFGDGWALIVGSVPFLGLAYFILRGLSRA